MIEILLMAWLFLCIPAEGFSLLPRQTGKFFSSVFKMIGQRRMHWL
jgi:hypothetical protein